MEKKINILLLFLFSALMSYGASGGYIITNNNDTIRGRVELKSGENNSTVCYFRENKKGAEDQKYLPGEIYGFRFNNDGHFFVSKEIKIDKKPMLVFAEFLVDGKMNLYYYKYKSLDYYFFENENGEMLDISKKPSFFDGQVLKTDSAYVNKLNYAFREFPKLSEDIRSGKKTINFERVDFVALVKDYHDLKCAPGEECLVFAYNYKKSYPILKITPYVGIQYLEYEWDRINETTSKSIYPAVGVQARLCFPRVSEELFLLVDGSLSGIKAKNELMKDKTTYTHIEYSALLTQWKVGVEYKYTRSQWQPFVQGGFASSFLLGKSTNNFDIYIENDEIKSKQVTSSDVFNPQTSFIGWFAGAGLSYQLANKQQVSVQFSYEQTKADNELEVVAKDKLSAFQLKVGYTF